MSASPAPMSASPAPHAGAIRRRALRALPALLAGALCAPLLMPASALATSTAATSFASPGVYGFTVPAGISSISVTVVGAAGGAGCLARAGEGASVSATIPVAPGELLQVGVGAPGGTTTCEAANIAAGIGGGGRGGEGVIGGLSGAGGGGASALALSSPSPGFQAESELVVAGGGGGAGQENGNGGNAGAAGSATSYGSFGGGGGGAGTQIGGGTSGSGQGDCIGEGTPESGLPGSLGLGGRGGNFSTEPYGAGAGGGGGGGYYGGGGGGSGCRGGGGGGGSSFVSPAVAVTEAATPTAQASGVTITYAAPTAEESSASLEFTGTQPQGVASAAQTLTVHNGGEAPLIVSGATLGGTDPDDYLLDNGCQAPVAVGSSCRIGVRFAPQAQGASSATLTLQTNAPVAPAAVDLSGTGGSLPEGPPGAQGAQGLQGTEGPRGAQGSSGEQGVQGPSGTPGAQGAQGLSGAQGIPGAPGAQGLAGSRGAQGAPGRRGATGGRGAPGEIRLESCVSTAVGARGHGPLRGPALRMTCTSQLERDPMSLPAGATASASLVRTGQLYATGEMAAGRLVLYSRRTLAPGVYALTLRWRSGAVTHTARRRFEVA